MQPWSRQYGSTKQLHQDHIQAEVTDKSLLEFGELPQKLFPASFCGSKPTIRKDFDWQKWSSLTGEVVNPSLNLRKPEPPVHPRWYGRNWRISVPAFPKGTPVSLEGLQATTVASNVPGAVGPIGTVTSLLPLELGEPGAPDPPVPPWTGRSVLAPRTTRTKTTARRTGNGVCFRNHTYDTMG